jgi:GNAT superfamily N-acetyltransferase
VTGAGAVLERVRELLLADEARHNLALGILSTAVAHAGVYGEVRGRGSSETVTGSSAPRCKRRPQPRAGRRLHDDLPGVVGATPEVSRFARAWEARRGSSVALRMEQRIYALQELRPPPPTDGAMRLADESDRELLIDWILAFAKETRGVGHPTDVESTGRTFEARLVDADAGFGLWEVAGHPVSLACFGGTTPSGIRVSAVHTPPEHRGRGYGSAVTAAVSQLNLDRGRRFCFLYMDLANPTSSSTYVRIGYEPVCDSRELAFGPRAPR